MKGRQMGKSTLYSSYGKLGVPNTTITVKPGYHGEWVVDVPWGIRWSDVRDWCFEAFGEPGRNRKCRWRINYVSDNNRIYLRYESDVTLLKLRWL